MKVLLIRWDVLHCKLVRMKSFINQMGWVTLQVIFSLDLETVYLRTLCLSITERPLSLGVSSLCLQTPTLLHARGMALYGPSACII